MAILSENFSLIRTRYDHNSGLAMISHILIKLRLLIDSVPSTFIRARAKRRIEMYRNRRSGVER